MILVDPPNAPGHGRLWSHLASDTSYEELHVFARRMGVPTRGFDRDHYDVPAEWYDDVVAAGAVPVTSRELISRLQAAGLRRRKSEVLRPRRPGRPLLRPPLLLPGSVVAPVAPAGPADPARVQAGVEVAREWGLEVTPAPAAAGERLPWLAAPDERRAADLAAAWLDPAVDAVWCVRGGFGSARLLDLLDWHRLATGRAKPLIGFSDVTALHQAFAARLGVSTVHGPGLAALADRDEATREALRALLLDGTATPVAGLVGAPGRAEGPVTGGNLVTLASLAGTRAVHPAAGSIALLEDVGEPPYRVDRALTQLVRSGWLDGVRGVVCGELTDGPADRDLLALLHARLDPLGVPWSYDVPVGHGRSNLAVPLGVRARLEEGRLTPEAHPARRAPG